MASTRKAGSHKASANGTPPPADSPVDPTDKAAAVAVLRFSRGHRLSKKTHRHVRDLERWGDLLQTLEDSDVVYRRDWPAQWLKFHAGRSCTPEQIEAMRRALIAAELAVEVEPDEPEADGPDEGRQPFRLDVLGALAFNRTEYRMEWLVRRILVAEQPGLIAAPRKGMKTSVIVDLAVSLAASDPFLGHFEVPEPVATLLLSGESGGFVIHDTMRRVCQTKGLDPDILEGQFFVGFALPQLSHREHLDELARTIDEKGIKVVLIDPLYLCLLSGAQMGRRIDPASIFDMGPLLLAISQACLKAGATPQLVHHFRKNGTSPYEEPELEDMSYAGCQEFARQWILLGRRKKFEPGSGLHELWLKVGGSAGHSGLWALDIAEGVMGDDFRGRSWKPSVRPADEVRTEAKAKDQAAKVDRQQEHMKAKDEARAKQVQEDGARALATLRTLGKATAGGWRATMKWSGERMDAAIALLHLQHRIRPADVEVPAGKSRKRLVAGWEATPEDTGTFPFEGGSEGAR